MILGVPLEGGIRRTVRHVQAGKHGKPTKIKMTSSHTRMKFGTRLAFMGLLGMCVGVAILSGPRMGAADGDVEIVRKADLPPIHELPEEIASQSVVWTTDSFILSYSSVGKPRTDDPKDLVAALTEHERWMDYPRKMLKLSEPVGKLLEQRGDRIPLVG